MDKVLRDTCQLVTAFNVLNFHEVPKVPKTNPKRYCCTISFNPGHNRTLIKLQNNPSSFQINIIGLGNMFKNRSMEFEKLKYTIS